MEKRTLAPTPWPCQTGRKCLTPCPGCPGQDGDARPDSRLVDDNSRIVGKGVEDHLAPGDLALIHIAAMGEGAVPLTPALLDNISASLTARFADIDERYPELVAAAPVNLRLDAAIVCVRALFEHARASGSFRYLIYGRLGLGQDAYVPLCADGLTLSNDLEIDAEAPDPLGKFSRKPSCVNAAVDGAWESFQKIENDTRLALVAAVFHAIVEESDPVEAVVLSGVKLDANGKEIPCRDEMRALLEACGLAAIEKAWETRRQ